MLTKTLSIITINKNNAAGLEETIQSVVAQTSTDFEYIVIDGASDDESTTVIGKYTDKINYWISEPDTGVYNAMNKGIDKAQGIYCLFLNSGDILVSPKTLDNVFKEVEGNPADIFYSDMIKSTNAIEHYPKILTMNYLVRRTISHQNALIKRSLFLEHGYYNENLKVASDWEFFLKEFWKHKSTFCHIETIISVFDVTGIGSQKCLEDIHHQEHRIVLQNIFNELSDVIIDYRVFYKTIYYDIYKNYGEQKILVFLLRICRKIMILRKHVFSFFVKSKVK